MTDPVQQASAVQIRHAGDVRMSPLAFGGAPIGNLYAEVGETEARAAVGHAWNQGIRHFDTAPYYGYGLSERRIGAALKSVDRNSYTLSSKVGRRIEADNGTGDHADGFVVDGCKAVFDYSRDGILRSFEASLERLQTSHIDVLLLHDIGALTHAGRHPMILRQALEEALPAMAELRSQGACKAIGIGVNEQAVCLEVMARFPLDAIMLAGRYTLFDHADSARLMAQAAAQGVAIMAAGPYSSGLLGGKAAPGHTFNYAPADEAVRERARRFYDIGAATGIDIGAAALQFARAHPAVATVVCGLRSVGEVDAANTRMHTMISSRTWALLREAGLLAHDVPTP